MVTDGYRPLNRWAPQVDINSANLARLNRVSHPVCFMSHPASTFAGNLVSLFYAAVGLQGGKGDGEDLPRLGEFSGGISGKSKTPIRAAENHSQLLHLVSP